MNHASPARPVSPDLARLIDAFESALAQDPGADLAAFLPDPDHPLHTPLLAELVRVDLELAWTRGAPRRVADYAARFPAVFGNPGVLGAVAFEEYRQRRRHGEATSPDEYRVAYGLDTAGWPPVDPDSDARPAAATGDGALDRTNVVAAVPFHPPLPVPAAVSPDGVGAGAVSVWVQAAESLPAPGTELIGFRLVEELGRGAFGRVYLARQGDLGGRPVALKVACDIVGESQTLAQLQHTNIVPIYSFHRAGRFQAVCMPYFGRTTLADVVKRLGGRSTLPGSGRELRSTLNARKDDTAPAADSPPAAEPAAPAPPAVERRTPDGWDRLEGLPYVEAVLWLGGQLADGLAHAHRRGILHRDLKPANVLLTDDGRPMLLDFNLAEDVKLRGSAERARVGGTLPYMAPEHMEAFRSGGGGLDGRCDLYALGVILYELLTGRHPFPNHMGPIRYVVPLMIADRRQRPPRLRDRNTAVSPGAEGIVRKLLAPDPADRYQTAEDLREDIDRHLHNRRLKHAPDPSWRERAVKWARRHPRLASSGSVAVAAALLLAALGGGAAYARERARGLEARGRYADHRTAFHDAELFLEDKHLGGVRPDEGLDRLRGVLDRYGVPEDGNEEWLRAAAVRYLPAADRDRVRQDVGEAFFLMARVAYREALGTVSDAERAARLDRAARWNDLAGRYAGDQLPNAVREQRAAVLELAGDAEGARRVREEAAATPRESARDLYLAGAQLAAEGKYREALPLLRRSTQLDPESFPAWFSRGTVHGALEQHDQAVTCFTACVALRPDFAPAWSNRGHAFLRLKQYEPARDDFDRVIVLDPGSADAHVQRAFARDGLRDLKGAEEDFTRALEGGSAPVRVYFLRASVRDRLKDKDGAAADRAKGLALVPTDELSWVARGETRMATDPAAALADADEALKVNPFSVAAFQLKAHILAERLNRTEEAVAVLNRAVERAPDYVPARAGRGVLFARLGRRDEALRDAKDALLRDTRPPNLYQAGCVYALTSKTHPEDRVEAFRLLWGGLKGGFGLDMVDSDPDLNPVRADPEFKRLVAAAKALHAAPKR